MKSVYIISLDRPGLADLPELVRCDSPEAVGEIVRALLAAKDDAILRVVVTVSRVAGS